MEKEKTVVSFAKAKFLTVLERLDSILPSATAALALYYLFSPLVAS